MILLPLLLLLASPHLDPAGVPGEILLVGDKLPDAALERFAQQVGKDGRVLLLTAGKEGGVTAKLKSKVKLETRPFAAADDGSAPDLKDYAGVWIAGSDGPSLRKRLPGIEKGCLALLRRGGIIAFSGAGLTLAAKRQVRAAESGLPLLPDAVIAARPTATVKAAMKRGGEVGYFVDPESALSVQGRAIRAMAGRVPLSLLPGGGRTETTITLEGRVMADLTTLRRSARNRRGVTFPPAKMAVPVVEKGTLVIIGGGGMPKGMVARFVELAGGKAARIVVLPTALPGTATRDGFGEACKRLGAKVTLLPGRLLKEVESKEYLDAMKAATGLWFGGGRQWRFVDAYEGTKLLPLMRGVLERGGVIGGSSAGATIQGEYLCRGGYFGNMQIASEGYERGFAFLPGTAIDQHFAQRKRQKGMSELMAMHPQLLGIGLDEATAIVVRKSRAEVSGRGEAHFYAGKAKPVLLKDGSVYDLKARRQIKE